MKTNIRVDLENGDRLLACAQPESKAVSLGGPLVLDDGKTVHHFMLLIPLSQVPNICQQLTDKASEAQRLIDAKKEPAHEA